MTREIVLDKDDLRDVIEFNAFWAERPSRVRLVMEEERQNGLWQLVIYDLKGSRWRLGAYIDGYEGRRTLYDMTLALYYDRYIDDSEEARKYDVTNDVIRKSSGEFIINLPDEWRPDVIIRIPALCGAGYPLAEPVFLGTLDNRYFALDCAGGIHYFSSLDELEAWIRERECREGHEYPVIHWWEWHIVVDGKVVYSEYVQPSPEDVISAIRKYLT
jgi:hypothetical protein